MSISLLAASLWALTLSRVERLSTNASVDGIKDLTKRSRESDAVVAYREWSGAGVIKGIRERMKGREKNSGKSRTSGGGGWGGGSGSRGDNRESEFVNFLNGSGVVLPPGVVRKLKKES